MRSLGWVVIDKATGTVLGYPSRLIYSTRGRALAAHRPGAWFLFKDAAKRDAHLRLPRAERLRIEREVGDAQCLAANYVLEVFAEVPDEQAQAVEREAPQG